MGSTSAQGWYLFLFLIGFTLGPAGLYALGWPIALVGFAMLAAAFAGFRSIRDPVDGPRTASREPLPSGLQTRTAKSY